jgi:DnaA family protein
VRLADESTFDNFLLRRAFEMLIAAAQAPAQDPVNFLHGGSEGGKSHLLQAVCHHRPGAVYLPLRELVEFSPDAVLAGLEDLPLLALDDLQSVVGVAVWEEALFHLINRARSAACPLWFAASKPPASLGIELADLRSRLGGGLLWALPPPDDEDRQAILRFRADRRGLRLSPAVAAYIVRRGRRSLNDLLVILDDLDEASLRLQRALTIPFVREVMGW